jgi:hypothetical protein
MEMPVMATRKEAEESSLPASCVALGGEMIERWEMDQ